MNGKSVVLPKYTFQTASKTFNSDPVALSNEDVLIVEGLHCLNEEVSKNIDKKKKYKKMAEKSIKSCKKIENMIQL